MSTSRRDFVRYSFAAGAMLAAGTRAKAASRAQGHAHSHAPIKILILGGTALIGPELVAAAQAKGHAVTLFNRGKTRPNLFPDLEKLRGDRDPKIGDGLKALEGRKFDVVFDNCGYYPRMVKASAELLAPNVGHYVYVSSISCYAKSDKLGADESAALATMSDPTVETMGEDYANYGPLKALCEQAAQAAMPGKTTVVRPGYIVGPGDWTHRFTYWPVRVSEGGEMLAPGAPSDPIQIIDVRDLAEWMVHLAEHKTTGVFNACGPEKKLTMGETLEACKRAAQADTKLTWVTPAFLEANQVQLPIWVPPSGETAGFHTWSNARAVASGLRFRPVETICKDTLAWYKEQPEETRKRMQRMPLEDEKKLLEKWHAEAAK